MRYAMLALFLVTLQVKAAPVITEKWAEKMFRESGAALTHDFGSVPRGAQLHHRFPITNIYAVPLQITQTRTSCGCVTVTPPAEPLKPREKGYIDITMDTRRFTGPKSVSIFVTVGPQFISTAILQVSANCRADVVFNPGELNFGVVPRGEKPTQTIDVEYAGTLWNTWKINEVAKNNAPLDVAIEELYRRPGQVGYRLKVTLKPDAPAGMNKLDLFLQTTDPASPMVPVLVEFTVQASLSVVPATLSVGTMKVGEKTPRRIVVRGNKPFRILSIEGLGEGIEAELPKEAAAVQIVTIKCEPTKAGDLRRQLLFKTDLEAEPTATMTVEGNVVP